MAGIIVSACIVACATPADPSGDTVSVSSDASADVAVLPPNDIDAAEADDTSAADAAMPCSSDGWCKTTLPGTNIYVKDVVPFEKRAFAMMNSAYIGLTIGEWTPNTGWTLLKGVQPHLPPYFFGGRLWAPDEDTVYFTVSDLSGFLGDSFGTVVVRGRRPVPPATEWTWASGKVSCDLYMLGAAVGGSEDGNVYVAGCGKIYRLDKSAAAGAASDGGADAGAETLQWIDEGFVDVDQASPIDFFDIGGTGPDDLWFAGGRVLDGFGSTGQSPCAILVHKTADGYRTVLDGIPLASGCSPRDDLPMVPGRLSQGIFNPSKNRVLAATEAVDENGKNVLLNVGLSGDQIRVATTRPPQSMATATLGSVWGTSEDDLFVIATYDYASSGERSALIRGQSIWGDSPSYDNSRLAINGVPSSNPLYRVRGTSSQNLWAVGQYNVYHKSTP
ncbi:hypothetical protein AKJ09_04498 [Labilithrix luteola]|uniref:Type IV fimbrial biogenesis protein PilY1 n=1 Tax=Labilithrix luteola TaxID=1391654 RepID=A0A0K1PXG4_9BACT|nr:hypothetical protein AKJ09_04498 [Labilithrix luteola]